MRKFNRNYQLSIETKNNRIITIQPPFSIEFQIKRTIGREVNSANIVIFNLNANTREAIGRDRYDQFDGGTGSLYRQIILRAGYNDLSTIFQGNITECISSRSGTDIRTSIEAFDGGYSIQNSYSSFGLQKGTSIKDTVVRLIKDMKKVILGKIEVDETQTLKKATAFEGRTFDILKDYTNNQIFIDEEKVNILDINSGFTSAGRIVVIAANTGLLSTPKLANTYIEIDIIFDPTIKIGQIVDLKSNIRKDLNNQYKVAGITHNVAISPRIAGVAKTTLQLYAGDKLFGKLKKLF